MNKPGQLLLYWDYELQAGADSSRIGVKMSGSEDYHQTEKILDLLDEYGVKSVFAVLGFAAQNGELPYHAPAQIRKIAERGHEVASHTWKHEWIPTMTEQQLRQVLRQSKQALESVIGKPVISFAPPWNVPTRYWRKFAPGFYDWRGGYPRTDIPALCRALCAEGFKTSRVDYEPLSASISRHAFKRVVSEPVKMAYEKDILCFKVNGSGFGSSSQEMLRRIAESGGLAVIFAHPHSLAAENDQNIQHFQEERKGCG